MITGTTQTVPTTGKFRNPDDAWNPPLGNGMRECAKAAALGWIIALPMVAFGGHMVYADWAGRENARLAAIERREAHARLVAAPAGEALAVAVAAHGRDLFLSTCAACHKADGTGVYGLGKDLTSSWFVASLDNDQLNHFVSVGRAFSHPDNTTGIPMPPKGNRPDLTRADLDDIVVYLRGLQDPRRLPALPPPVAVAIAPPTETEKAAALAAAGGDAELAEYIALGTKLFAGTCSACHGKDAHGLPRLGKDLVNSEFCKNLDDDGLLAFIKKGRDPSDPANTTQVGMPPKGGNPALTDDDILDVIAYVRSLQTASIKQ